VLNWDKIVLKGWNKQHLVFFEDFEGAVTSVIFWKRTRGHKEVKEFMSCPLSNVDELQSKL
jgi:predicted N-acetyltransferase YhbS